MYNFIDVTEVSESVLPSEALQLNGEYIENLIPGYRTVSVSGREALSPLFTTFETGVRDGSTAQNKRYPERIITIRYQLTAKTCEEFREAYNKLGSILNVDDAELIFRDETDKFYTGTPSAIGAVEPGLNSVIGEFEITCTDPFKYSVVEYEAESFLNDGSILIDYKGTYKSFPTLVSEFYKESDVTEDGNAGTLTGNGDCGYVAFYNDRENIIQLGDPEENDTETAYKKSQTLINQIFSNWSAAAQAPWVLNSGDVIPSDIVQNGSVGMLVADYTAPPNPVNTSGTLCTVSSTMSEPRFDYTVTAKTSGRTANSVKVDVTITTSLRYDGSYFGRGYGLQASLYIGGTWRTVVLKTTEEYWKGKTGHVANMSFVVSGLNGNTDLLSGIKFKTDRTDTTGGTAGIVRDTNCNNLKISTYQEKVPETNCLGATNYGTSTEKWYGASIKRTLKADASGETGASNFTFSYEQKMCAGSASQLGEFQAQISASDGKNVAGVKVKKYKYGNNAQIVLYVNGKAMDIIDIDLSNSNKYFGDTLKSVKTSTITKTGSKVSFNIAGISRSFVDGSISDVKAAKVTFLFTRHKDYKTLSYNGLYWVKFVKNNCTTWKDIPNKFSANDVIYADCKDGKIFLNGIESPQYGSLGNDWEEFYLSNGLNQIGAAYSEWVAEEYAPKFKVRYREVFL